MSACAITCVAGFHNFLLQIPRCLLPLLHHHTTSLKLSQITKHSTLIDKLIARECSHQYPRTRLADRAGCSDKLVDIVNSVSGVESGRKACSVTESDLQSDSRLRLVHVGFCGFGDGLARGSSSSRSRRRCGAGARCWAPKSESLSGERLVLGLGLHVFLLMLLNLHIHLLASLHVHYRKGSASLSNSVENLCVPCIVRAVQVSIVNRETVRPKVEGPLNSLWQLGSSRSTGSLDHLTGSIIATQSTGGTGEVVSSGLGVVRGWELGSVRVSCCK